MEARYFTSYYNEKNELLKELSNDKLIIKYICKYTWLSGSSTKCYPITCNYNEDIIIQINTDRNYFTKYIDKKVKKYNNILKYGYFWKSDDSCPSQLIFKFKEAE